MDKKEVQDAIKNKDQRLKLIRNVNKKSPVWEIFENIEFDGKLLNYVCCSKCKSVLVYSPKNGTGSLRRHNCIEITAQPTLTNYVQKSHDIIGPDSEMFSPNRSDGISAFYLKQDTESHNMELQSNSNSTEEVPQNRDVVNTNFITTDSQNEVLSMQYDNKVSSKKQIEEPDIMEELEIQLQTMEENLKRAMKKRFKKMEKKMLQIQKSMLSDILFLYKEQPEACDAEEGNSSQPPPPPQSALLELPINSIEKFNDFEQNLKSNAKLQNNLISSFLSINCASPGEYIRICWSKMLTDDVSSQFSWSISSTKSSISSRLIAKTIKKAFAIKFPLNQEKFYTVSKKYFQYAKDRLTKLEVKNEDTLELKSSKVFQKFSPKLKANKGTCDVVDRNLLKETEPSTSSMLDFESNYKIINAPSTVDIVQITETVPKVSLSSSIKAEIQENNNHSEIMTESPPTNRKRKVKNPPKSSAQRSREYRMRKKRFKALQSMDGANQSQSNDSLISLEFFKDDNETISSDFSSKFEESTNCEDLNENEKSFNENAQDAHPTERGEGEAIISGATSNDNSLTKIDISGYGFANQSKCGQSSHTNDDTSQEYAAILYDDSFWKTPSKDRKIVRKKVNNQVKQGGEFENSKPPPKTSAERSRAYRIRKKILRAAALQRKQLEMECFSTNTDPLSNDSTSI